MDLRPFISQSARVDETAYLASDVILLGSAEVGRHVIIEDGCIVGKPARDELRKGVAPHDFAAYEALSTGVTRLADRVVLQRGTIVYAGTTLEEEVFCEDGACIRWGSTVGWGTRVMYRAQISARVSIGSQCRIGGFCCNDSKVGDFCSMFGSLVHKYSQYGGGRVDPAPILRDRVTVGFGAVVIGGVTIESDSYIAAGAIVTRDVPAGSIVIGVNRCSPIEEWSGDLGRDYGPSFEESEA